MGKLTRAFAAFFLVVACGDSSDPAAGSDKAGTNGPGEGTGGSLADGGAGGGDLDASSGGGGGAGDAGALGDADPGNAAPQLRDKMGVVFQVDTTGPLQRIEKAIEAMRYLGFDTLRIRAPRIGADSWNRIYVPLGTAGLRFHFVHAPGREPAEEVADLVSFAARFPGQIIGYEGPNEPDLDPVTFGGATDTRLGARTGNAPAALALQEAMYTQLRAHFTAQQIPMLAFNDWMHAEQSPFSDYANTHVYPNAGNTLSDHASGLDELLAAHGKGKLVVTEVGYTDVDGPVHSHVTPEQEALNVIEDMDTVMARADIVRAFFYSVVDYPNPTDEFSNFGLFESDWTPKPSAEAIHARTGGL